MSTRYFEISGGPLDGSSFGVDTGESPPPEEIYWRRSNSDSRVAVHERKRINGRWVYKFDGWNTTKELGHEHHEVD